MRKITSTVLILLMSFSFFSFANSADEKINEEKSAMDFYDGMSLNFFTGMFDFSDDKQSSVAFGMQHQDIELFRKTSLGTFSPVTGFFFLPGSSASYIYTGVQAEYEIGRLKITPSFAPGFYEKGNGKDVGSPLEFKSEVQMSFDFSKNNRLGMSYNHISNASLGSKNPGANSYMFNFLRQF